MSWRTNMIENYRNMIATTEASLAMMADGRFGTRHGKVDDTATSIENARIVIASCERGIAQLEAMED